jgi:hypothetical protein
MEDERKVTYHGGCVPAFFSRNLFVMPDHDDTILKVSELASFPAGKV